MRYSLGLALGALVFLVLGGCATAYTKEPLSGAGPKAQAPALDLSGSAQEALRSAPSEPIAVCQGLSEGTPCTFNIQGHDISGHCRLQDDSETLGCAPQHRPQGPPPSLSYPTQAH